MSLFTRFNRKAALLLAKLTEDGFTDGNVRIDALGGRTLNTLRYWRWRRSDAEYRDASRVSDALKSYFEISDARNLLSEEVPVKDFADLVGYEPTQARRIVDQTYNEIFATYSIFYAPERAARDVLDRFAGINLVYRIENNDRVKGYTGQGTNVLRMPLVVRYMMRGAKPPLKELYRVRCKLTVPSYTVATPCFEYDGYVTSQKYDTHYWLFENRSEENKDLLLMITDSLPIHRRRGATDPVRQHGFAEGIMITRRQDQWPTHKIWKIVVVKQPLPAADDEADPEAAMTSECAVITKDETPSWIYELLAQRWSGLDPSSFPP